MKKRGLGLAILVSLFVGMGTLPGQGDKGSSKTLQIAIVVGKENPIKSLELQELRRIFLREQIQWPNGWKITVYERHTSNPIREQFSRLVLGKKPEELAGYWLKLKLTRGIKAPQICQSKLLLTRYLERVKGGIGYLYASEVDNQVKVVKILEVKAP